MSEAIKRMIVELEDALQVAYNAKPDDQSTARETLDIISSELIAAGVSKVFTETPSGQLKHLDLSSMDFE